jgi:hypothetical protein
MKTIALRHSLLIVIPAKAGIQCLSCINHEIAEEQSRWIPAFAGMTAEGVSATEVAQ